MKKLKNILFVLLGFLAFLLIDYVIFTIGKV